jgi:hypothetical protein
MHAPTYLLPSGTTVKAVTMIPSPCPFHPGRDIVLSLSSDLPHGLYGELQGTTTSTIIQEVKVPDFQNNPLAYEFSDFNNT